MKYISSSTRLKSSSFSSGFNTRFKQKKRLFNFSKPLLASVKDKSRALKACFLSSFYFSKNNCVKNFKLCEKNIRNLAVFSCYDDVDISNLAIDELSDILISFNSRLNHRKMIDLDFVLKLVLLNFYFNNKMHNLTKRFHKYLLSINLSSRKSLEKSVLKYLEDTKFFDFSNRLFASI